MQLSEKYVTDEWTLFNKRIVNEKKKKENFLAPTTFFVCLFFVCLHKHTPTR